MEIQSIVRQELEAHFKRTRSTAADDAAIAVSKRWKVDAAAAAAAVQKASDAAAAARIRGANFNELAVNNGFKLEAADPMDQWDHDKLFCTACCYWSKKRGQQEPQPITCNSALSKIKGRVIKH